MHWAFKKNVQEVKGEKMAEQPLPRKGQDVNALLGKGSEFEGKLTFEGSVQIDGVFTGEIFSDGTLIIGQGAKVKAEISVDTFILYGEMSGNVKAKSSIEIHSSGKLKGNIQTSILIVAKGAIFDGSCTMQGESVKKPVIKTPPSIQVDEKHVSVKNVV